MCSGRTEIGEARRLEDLVGVGLLGSRSSCGEHHGVDLRRRPNTRCCARRRLSARPGNRRRRDRGRGAPSRVRCAAPTSGWARSRSSGPSRLSAAVPSVRLTGLARKSPAATGPRAAGRRAAAGTTNVPRLAGDRLPPLRAADRRPEEERNHDRPVVEVGAVHESVLCGEHWECDDDREQQPFRREHGQEGHRREPEHHLRERRAAEELPDQRGHAVERMRDGVHRAVAEIREALQPPTVDAEAERRSVRRSPPRASPRPRSLPIVSTAGRGR